MSDAMEIQVPESSVDSKESRRENLPWVEKYRPSGLDELISHEEILNTLQQLIKSNRLPHLLFYGPPGTGKTSTILSIARQINGPKYSSMILELNASDDRGIDVVRDQIKDFASSKKLFSSGFKLVILDEADAMTKTAQFALRRIIEKYTKNTRFCLICNYANKIIPALQSRCTKFRFGPLGPEQIVGRLKDIAVKEGVEMTEEGMKAIIKLSEGDMRKCLNILQSAHLAYNRVDDRAVYLCTGFPMPEDIQAILNALLNRSMSEAVQFISQLQTAKGLSLVDIVQHLHTLILRTNFPPSVLGYILDQMSDVEHRLSFGTNEKVQMAGLVGIFQIAKQKLNDIQKSHEI